MVAAAEFLRALDELATARPPGDPVLPIVTCRGEGAGQVVEEFCGHVLNVVPTAVVGGVAAADDDVRSPQQADIGLVDQIADALIPMPSGMGTARLPAYVTLRAAMSEDITLAPPARPRQRLRRRLLKVLGGGDPAPDGVDRMPNALQRIVRADDVLLVFHWLLRLAVRLRLRRNKGLQAVGDHVASALQRPRQGFLESAKHLTVQGEARQRDDLVREAMVLALLHDLDWETRPSRWSPWRRRRVTPFVVLFPSVPRTGPARRILDTLIALHGRQKRGALLVVAAVETGDDLKPIEGATEDLRSVIAGNALSEAELAVAVPALDQDAPWPPNPQLRPGPGPSLWPVVLRWAGAGLLGMVLVVAVIVVIGRIRDPGDGCRYEQERTGDDPSELVGIGDGTKDCSFFTGEPGPGGPTMQEKNRTVEASIAAVNQEIEPEDDYRTVVFFAPMTVPDKAERLGQTALRQMRGVAMAQETIYTQSTHDATRVPIRILLANPGDRFEHGVRVAEQIRELAEQDDTVVGVVGIAQSRDDSQRAVRTLTEAGLPVVAGPLTGDFMADISSPYYQLTPTNRRVSAVFDAFLADARVVGEDGSARPARDAVVVFDPEDAYSRNLAEDFDAAFAEPGVHDIRPVEHDVGDDGGAGLGELADEVCGLIDPERDIVFFALRSQQLVGMLDGMAVNACAGGFTVVAGSDVTKFVQAPEVELPEYDFVRLYYASFGFATRDEGLPRSEIQVRFHDDYREEYHSNVAAFDVGDAAITYDALWALSEAIDGGRASLGGVSPGRDVVAGQLGAGVTFSGVSGHVTLESASRLPEDKLVLVVEVNILGDGRLRRTPLMACGRLSGEEVTDCGVGALTCPPDAP
jgi:ABC-type branched-subunit amino acid transport system substrate-binding protein